MSIVKNLALSWPGLLVFQGLDLWIDEEPTDFWLLRKRQIAVTIMLYFKEK